MPPILSVHTWVSLPHDVRYRIRSLFTIPRSSNTVVNDGVLETDGTTVEDFRHLTIEKMQAYLMTDVTDFHKLFDLVVARINDELSPVSVSPETPITVIIEPAAPKKKVKKTTK
jgi:hypothetical protein